MKFEPFSIELFNDGETLERAFIREELTMIVASVHSKEVGRFIVDTAHILAIADAIRQKKEKT